jgi:hypothetical protein
LLDRAGPRPDALGPRAIVFAALSCDVHDVFRDLLQKIFPDRHTAKTSGDTFASDPWIANSRSSLDDAVTAAALAGATLTAVVDDETCRLSPTTLSVNRLGSRSRSAG